MLINTLMNPNNNKKPKKGPSTNNNEHTHKELQNVKIYIIQQIHSVQHTDNFLYLFFAVMLLLYIYMSTHLFL